MPEFTKRANDYVIRYLWRAETMPLGSLKAFRLKFLRIIYSAFRGMYEEELSLRAMSLVYTTLLSIVPLLAVSLSLLKAFGVHTRFEIFLYYFLEPLGERGVDIALKVIGFVENMKESVLGSIGLSMLIYTVISLVQKVESALNSMWNVRGTRSFAKRFSNYLSVLLVGPVLIFSAAGISTSLMSAKVVQEISSVEPFGTLLYILGKIIPYVFIGTAFTLIYIFLPNTKVRLSSAMVGGIFAAVLLESMSWGFRTFIASSARYSAIYSGFAAIILAMIWIFMNWFILLVGARVAFYYQHPHFLGHMDSGSGQGSTAQEKLSLQIMFLIGSSFYFGRPSWTAESLLTRLGGNPAAVHNTLSSLLSRGLLVTTGDDPPSYLPGKDIETISLKEVIDSARKPAEAIQTQAGTGSAQSISSVEDSMESIEEAICRACEGKTVKSLVLSGDPSSRGM